MGKSPSHKKEHTSTPEWAKEQDNFVKGKKFPNCKGTFPDCPAEVKADDAPDSCKLCPFYKG